MSGSGSQPMGMGQEMIPIPMPAQLPPMSSYGTPTPGWNQEMMELLVDIEIPEEYMNNELGQKVFVWYKKVLMQMQFGNYTAAVQRKLIKDLQYILFLGSQEGNEGLVFEAQLIFIANLMILKGRSDLPDGMRERTMWISQWIKNIFGDERIPKPTENKGILSNMPWSRQV